jgi:hypothetical protein
MPQHPTREPTGWTGGPILSAMAVLAALASVRLAIAAYLAIPLLYVVLRKAELWEEAG